VKPDLKPGVGDEQTITTTPDMGIVHLGPDAPSMYSTPAMVLTCPPKTVPVVN